MMNNKKEWDTASLGVTYQMSLDAFLKDSYHASYSKSQAYEDALMKLKEMYVFVVVGLVMLHI